ncbi:MAG: hypothetical protein L0332_15185 [Chloroflexi bacterium]|nr:hypothetical protein [Chloroflexota bacterium]MCI0577756.1 hypothetical protein [Chloroflexota bacterium]MCI0644662.1 hypothetical protein [Chloroflexota bacterium]MCI0728046.1 hypothetical protein [Chloroflexota bacterium]
MSTQVSSQPQSSLLSNVLRSDGAFSLVSGVACLAAAGPIAGLIGLAAPAVLAGLGVVLLGYAAMLFFYAGREPENQAVARLAVFLNVAWVLGSYAGLLFGWFPVNTAGKWAIALAAEAVFLFAALEFFALRRVGRR